MWNCPERIPPHLRTHAQQLEAARNEREARRAAGLCVFGILTALYIIAGIIERMCA